MSRKRRGKYRPSTVTIRKNKSHPPSQPITTPDTLSAESLDQLPDSIKALAMAWYERGIRRGLKKATDLMLEDEIYKNEGMLHAPTTITLSVKTRLKGEDWENRVIEVSAEEIGFEQ